MDYTNWLTKQQAADAIGVSTKTIEAMAKAGSLHKGSRKNPGTGANVACYHPDDVAREASKRNPGAPAFVMPAESNTRLALLPAQIPPPSPYLELASIIGQNGQNRSRVALSEKLYLTIPEAVELSGLPHGIVLAAARDGMGFQPGNKRGWLIKRESLMCLNLNRAAASRTTTVLNYSGV